MCVVQHFGQLHVQAGFTAMRSSCGQSLGLACPGETDACALSYAGGPSQLWHTSKMVFLSLKKDYRDVEASKIFEYQLASEGLM